MKLKGKKIEGPNEVPIVIPRHNRDNLEFVAVAVLDYTDHDKLNPMPFPPVRSEPDKAETPLLQDPDYLQAKQKWGERKTHWMILTSLAATPELEWESVDMDEPESWENYQEELKESGLSELEISNIISAVIQACGLDQEKIDLATESFLVSRGMG